MRDVPYFVEAESDNSLDRWEEDSYLVDRRKIISAIIAMNAERLDILTLSSELGVSDVSLVKTLAKLKDLKVIKEIDSRLIELTKNANMIIFKNRNELLRPKLNKVWNEIPNDLKKQS